MDEAGTQPDLDTSGGEIDTLAVGKKRKHNPRRYQPPVLAPVTKPRTQIPTKDASANGTQNKFRLNIAICVYFRRDESVYVSLLLGRRPEISDLIDADLLGQEINLVSQTDDWFEGISLPEIGTLLEKGVGGRYNLVLHLWH